MTKEYIEVKIPILDEVKKMEVVKTFDEKQLWYVCAIAKAFEKSEQKNANYKQALIDIREYIHSEEFFMLMNSGSIIDCPPDKPIGEDYFKAQSKLDQIIDNIIGDDK